jgi:hypothetical protein
MGAIMEAEFQHAQLQLLDVTVKFIEAWAKSKSARSRRTR